MSSGIYGLQTKLKFIFYEITEFISTHWRYAPSTMGYHDRDSRSLQHSNPFNKIAGPYKSALIAAPRLLLFVMLI